MKPLLFIAIDCFWIIFIVISVVIVCTPGTTDIGRNIGAGLLFALGFVGITCSLLFAGKFIDKIEGMK
jgi:hypothetical protein